MTKEELKQEAEEYTKNLLKKLGIKEDMLLENQPKYLRQESMNFVALDVENVTDAYLASAEPREKQIQALGERCLQLQKDKGELTDRVKELEEKLANADYQLEGRDLEIKELQQENERLKTLMQDEHIGNGEFWKGVWTYVRENKSLKAQIEKMKLCQNCKFEENDYFAKPCCDCTRCLGDIKRKGNSDKWEIKEK